MRFCRREDRFVLWEDALRNLSKEAFEFSFSLVVLPVLEPTVLEFRTLNPSGSVKEENRYDTEEVSCKLSRTKRLFLHQTSSRFSLFSCYNPNLPRTKCYHTTQVFQIKPLYSYSFSAALSTQLTSPSNEIAPPPFFPLLKR